jgi:C_GCAxxG_C_C family probable redox protein
MERSERAVALFRQQFNCSQAVFTAFRREEEMTETVALKLGTIYGAGVAGSGSGTCGAVSGALMAISMRHGRGDVEGVEAKTKTYELGRRFQTEFGSRMGSCRCEGILGINIGTPENLAKAREMKLFETRCLEAVEVAAGILEEML